MADTCPRPARLIHIVDNTHDPVLSLVSGQGICEYATLGHCWGGTVPNRLLKENIGLLQNNIDWSTLAATFRDAVRVASTLGFAYLWINALCIIQDSREDWTTQAGTMTDVYAGSALNICAAASHDSRGGLFRTRDPTKPSPFIVPGTTNRLWQRCFVDDWNTAFRQAPLYDRAWVIQERYLAT